MSELKLWLNYHVWLRRSSINSCATCYSYLIGGELVEQGVSLYAVSAFIISWVTLGLIQLPAEVEVFGGRFTLYRNILSFVFTMLIAVATTFTWQVLS